MKILEIEDYNKLTEPLKKVTINNLFARSVVEHKVAGKVFVDNLVNPKTYYVVHPYGMTLLFGESNNEAFNNSFRDYSLNINHVRNTHEWMQAFPGSWNNVLNELFKDCLIKSAENKMKKETGIIELNTRVNFKFNHGKYLSFRKANLALDIKIVRTDKQIFRDMKGSVVPFYFWDSEDDFLKNGVGFSLFYKDKLASTAYSSYIHDDKFELGIETVEEFRGKGFAEYTCSALIDYCIKNNYEPIWSCRLENIGSYKLAQKIGFIPSAEIPYYRLSK
ncbi:MAG: GNAT family N-acetyltransferase [Bacteroidales bacterium]|nr:GNAT family N-acetyltransferase [Bacteroidales bacterium]